MQANANGDTYGTFHLDVKDTSIAWMGSLPGSIDKMIAAGAGVSIPLNLSGTFNWYDLSVKVEGYQNFEERFAGRVETGLITKTDPLMGGVV
jgi:hypothetical protein